LGHLTALLKDIFPDQFTKPCVVTDPESPLIYSGSLLHISDVNMLPVQKKEVLKTTSAGVKLYGAFGSYGVIESLVVLQPKDSYKFLWSRTRDLLIWIASVSYRDDLDHLLSVFNDTGFGAARLAGRQGRTLITLEDVVDKVRRRELSSELDLDEISSEPFTVSKDTMLGDALHLMFEARVRRLFVDEPTRFVSDRTILAYLFSPFMLKIAKDSPDKWLDVRIEQLPKGEAVPVRAEASLTEGATLLGSLPDDCLLTSRNRVVTRWDIVIKSWKKDLNLVAAQPTTTRVHANHPLKRES
jgi:CBS domain-containing protein